MIAYSKYKDSGIPWLGQIPEHWDVKQLSQVAFEQFISNKEVHHQNLLSLSYGNIIRKDINTAGGLLPTSFDTYQIVEEGNIVLRLTDLQNDHKSLRVGLAKEEGIITSAYVCLGITNKQELNPTYLYRLLHTYDIWKLFYSMGGGIRQGLNWQGLKKINVVLPPLAEQEKIVAFIDDKTSKIDRYIAEREKELQKLAELKQSEIAAAVTRGLNPNVPMKDSGIPWLGQIPKHWEMRRIKYIFSELKDRSTTGEETALSLTKENGLIPSSEKQNKTMESESLVGCKIIHKGEVVFNRFKARLFAVSNYDGVVSSDYAVYSCDKNAFARYMVTLFNTPIYREAFHRKASGIGDGFNRLYTDDLFAMYSIFPPLAEQRAIVEYIDSKCSEINSLISNIEAEIAYLKEYKQSLIADAVTGAINVQ